MDRIGAMLILAVASCSSSSSAGDVSILHDHSADQADPADGPSSETKESSVDAEVVPPEVVPAEEAWLAWESTRNGAVPHIFLMKVHPDGEKGSEPIQLTKGQGGQTPLWSPDGRYISYHHPIESSTYLMRPDGSNARKISDGSPAFWLQDGSGIASLKGNALYLVDPETGDHSLMFNKDDFAHFPGKMMQPAGITADGKYMVVGTDLYRYGHEGTNGSFTASFAAAVVDLTDKQKVFFFGSGCAPRTPPQGDFIYHVCGDCPTKPDVYRMRLSDLMTRSSYTPELAHPDPDWGHSYCPRISNDNKWLAYCASTGCHSAATCDYEIFIHRLRSGPTTRTRMTFHEKKDRTPALWVGALP